MLGRLLRKTSKGKKKPGIGLALTLVLLLIVLVPIVYSLVHHPDKAKAAWYDPFWQYREKITILDTKVTGTTDKTNFPVLISITDATLGTYAQTDGDDIVFTDQNGMKLDHEIEKYTTGTGVLVAWVRIPTLYAQQDTIIYMYYGNPSSLNQQNVAGVWGTDYLEVYHLSEAVTDEQTTGTYKDSTLTNEELIQNNNDDITGQISVGQDFDGTADWISRGSGFSAVPDLPLNIADGDSRTFSVWFNRDTFTTTQALYARKNGVGVGGGFQLHIDATVDDLTFSIADGVDQYQLNGTSTFTATGWHLVTVVYSDASATDTKIYVDGLDDTQTRTGTLANINAIAPQLSFTIGTTSNNTLPMDGKEDEMRIRGNAVDDDWVLTEYNNQSSPSTFETVGSVEISPGPVAFWKFDEGVDNTCSGGANDACDATGGLHDLARTNPLWTQEGQCVSGKCASYDGSGDYFNIADNADLDFAGTDSFTITGWFQHGPQTSGQDVIVAKYLASSGTDGGYKVLMESDGDITCGIDNDQTSFPSDSATSIAATYDDNAWHHFACVKNGTTSLTLYLDGAQVAQDASITSATLANTDAFYIGIDGDGSSNGWQGFLDEVKVYRSAKSAAQVQTEYAARGSVLGSSATMGGGGGQGGDDNAQAFLSSGLTGYWKMDETAANTCTGGANDTCDSSGNVNDGAWSGGATKSTGRFASGTTYDGTDDFTDFGDPASGLQDIGAGSFTYSMWVNVTSNISTDDLALFKGGTSAGNTGYDMELGSGTWVAGVSDGTTRVSGQFAATGTTGSWKLLTVVVDRNNKKLNVFMDGQQTDSQSIAALGTTIDSTRTLRLGTDNSSNLDFNGLIDDFRIYNRAFSPAEVNRLFNWGPGPIGYWKLDENTGTTTAYDSSGNSRNGTLTNITEAKWVPGKYGSNLDFDGTDDNVEIADNDAFSIVTTNTLSVSAWINGDDYGSTRGIVTKGAGGGNYEWTMRVNSDATVRGLVLATDGTTYMQATGETISTKAWHHIEMTVDLNAPTIKIYVDGHLSGSSAATAGAIANGTSVVRIGERGDGNEDFDGRIDDVRIYNYVRNEAQVTQDLNAGHPLGGSPVGSATGNWALDEQGGQTASDQLNVYNATLGSSATSDTNDPTWKLPDICKINGCLDFDGSNDFVAVPDNVGIGLDMLDDDDFTITGWFNRDTFTTDDTIVAKRNGQAAGDTGYVVYIDDSTDKVTFEVSDGTDEYQVVSNSTFTATGWNHFAIVFKQDDANQIKMYINGLDNTGTKTGTLSAIGSISNSVDFRIGAESDAGTTPDNPFDGKLDDIQLYKAALSQDNVQVVYNVNSSVNYGGKTIEANNLADGAGTNPNLYFPFDENNATASAQTITIDSISDVATNSAAATAQMPFTTNTHANQILVVALNGEDATAADLVATTVTYNGIGLSKAEAVTSASGFVRSEQWYLLNPPTGAYNITVTYTGTVSSRSMGAMTFYNVKQDSHEATGTTSGTTGTTSTVNITTFTPGAMIIDSISTGANNNVAPGTSQTERYDRTSGAHGSGGSTKLWNTPSATTMVQTITSGTFAHVAIALAPAAVTNTATDRSGSNLTTTFAGSMGGNSWADGKYGTALKFNGTTDYATIATPGLSTTDFTIEGWVNTTDPNGSVFTISDKDIAEKEVGITIGEAASAGAVGVYLNDSLIMESTTLVNTGDWYHFAYTRIGTADRLYINGILEDTAVDILGALDYGTCSAILGADPQLADAVTCVGTPNSVFWAGKLDELKTYSYGRSQAQIFQDFNRGGPVGRWKADECTGTTVYDSSGRGNNGTLTIGNTGTYIIAGNCNSGTANQSWNTGKNGKFNSSFALDGTDDYVNIGDISILDVNDTQDFSISGWFYRNSFTTDDTVVAKRNGQANTDDGYIVYIDDATDKLTFEVSDTADTDEYQLESTTTFTTTGWHHFVIVFDDDTAATTTMYIDGRDDSPTKTGTLANIGSLIEAVNFRIGAESDAGQPFDGQIDDIRFFKYALSATQAKLLMNNGAEARFGPTSGLP